MELPSFPYISRCPSTFKLCCEVSLVASEIPWQQSLTKVGADEGLTSRRRHSMELSSTYISPYPTQGLSPAMNAKLDEAHVVCIFIDNDP